MNKNKVDPLFRKSIGHNSDWKSRFSIAICAIMSLFFVLIISSCSVTRNIPEGKHVVDRAHIEVDGVWTNNSELRQTIKQKPYHRTFGFMPVSTWIYNLAGSDSTSRWNQWLRRVGTAPPIYDDFMSQRTVRAIERTMHARGYMDAEVTYKTDYKKKKVSVVYKVKRNAPMVVDSVAYQVEDDNLRPFIYAERSSAIIQPSMLLDRSILDKERTRITQYLRNEGYWSFEKDDIRFIADTLASSQKVDLIVVISGKHKPYRIRDVWFISDFDLLSDNSDHNSERLHTVSIEKGYHLRYTGEKCYLREKTLLENTHIVPGTWYAERDVQNTYNSYSRLHALRYVNIRMEEVGQDSLDCLIYLSPAKPHSLQFELEGTNTSGDLGFAAASTYRHANIFRGSETYSATIKGGYESLSGNVTDLVNDNYKEFTVENSLNFPRFLFPFIDRESRRRSRATTMINASYSYQSRPEYTRIITNGVFGYNCFSENRHMRHVWEVADFSYVHLPKRSKSFLDIIQNAGPITYSSYQSHLILSMSYSFYYGNVSSSMATSQRQQSSRDVWTLRISPEVGGNTLSLLSRALSLPRKDGAYQWFDLRFEQYASFDIDYSYSKFLTDRSRLAFHWAGGVAVPYGNSSIMPFEKRYYSGGANNVRGWSVRTLGPGRYKSDGSTLDYFNQCGDIRLDMSIELRSKLFWNFEFAAFVDAGNVWTLRDYDSQQGGAISTDFYKEIAASWGVGLRLVTDFMVLRLDLGIKAHDPARMGKEAWVIDSPQDKDNRTIHFAVGYPF